MVESGWGKDKNFKSCGGGVKAFNSPTRGEPAFITSWGPSELRDGEDANREEEGEKLSGKWVS